MLIISDAGVRCRKRKLAWPTTIGALLISAMTMLCSASAHAGDAALRLAAEFSARLESELASRDVPGAAWVIVHRGQVLALDTYGYAALGQTDPVDVNTQFRIASLSKGFSGVLAAMLSTEERFSLDQPVATFSPAFRIRPTGKALTIEDVLGQRSGFIRNAYDNLLEAGISRSEILPRFNKLEPLCPPGRCYSYQNNVFSLIEDVVARTTGREFEAELDRRIFQPLGMANASVGFDPFISSDNRAEPHLKTRSGWRRTAPRRTYYQVPSAAGINASIVDMAQWAIALLGHRPDVIPNAVIDQVLDPRIRTAGELNGRIWRGALTDAWYGLGWRIYQLGGHRLALHGGWVAGYRAEIALSRELDMGLVILSNAETRAVAELNRFFWERAIEKPLTAAAAGPASTNPDALTGGAAVVPPDHSPAGDREP